MYAILDLHFRRPVNAAELTRHLAPPTGIRSVIGESVFDFDEDVLSNAVYATRSISNICIIFPTGTQGLQIHVETRLANGSIAELKKEVARIFRSVQNACDQSKQRVNASSVAIYAEENRITDGKPAGVIAGAWQRARDRIYYDLALALTPIPLGLWFKRPIAESAFTAAAIVIALGVIILIESGRHRGEVSYEDV